MTDVIHVAVGVLIDDANYVLLARRKKGTHLEGYWEFPGGKVELDETVEAALARELAEELGVSIATIRNWSKLDNFPSPITNSGKTPIYRTSEIISWLENEERS